MTLPPAYCPLDNRKKQTSRYAGQAGGRVDWAFEGLLWTPISVQVTPQLFAYCTKCNLKIVGDFKYMKKESLIYIRPATRVKEVVG